MSNNAHKWMEKSETDNEGATTIGFFCTKCGMRKKERPVDYGDPHRNYKEWQYQYGDSHWTTQYRPCTRRFVLVNNSGVYLQQINARHRWDNSQKQWVNVYEMTLANHDGKSGSLELSVKQYRHLALILAELNQQPSEEDTNEHGKTTSD